jgi:glycolate oxidase FAD binding subunit
MSIVAASSATEAIADRVREAQAARTSLRIVGGGSWLDAGRPVRATTLLDVGTLSGIVEYEPGDLTLTVRAGTTLAEIERVTGENGQWLPLDPFGSAQGTIGATVATASAGPLAAMYGTPRDHLLGCEFVSGTADVVRAGGRVVKNVAGFDLVRLVTGAWGTLGAITEVTVRLRARPATECTLAVPAGAEAGWRWLRTADVSPLAAELVSPALARALGVGEGSMLLIRFGGNDAFVRDARDAAATIGETRDVDVGVWRALAVSEPEDASVVRLSTVPSRVGALWERASAIVERVGGYAHATLSRGVIRCVVPRQEDDEQNARLRGIIGSLRIEATCIAERLPPVLWSSLIPAAASDELSQRVRSAFDPHRLFNPGIFGEPA